MSIQNEIGERIRSARKNKELSTVKLAEQMGMSFQVVSHWENGRRTPTLESIISLSKILEVPASFLLCINDDPNIPRSISIPLHEIESFSNSDFISDIVISTKLINDANDLIAVKLSDDSMDNLFRKGDIIVVNTRKPAYDRSLVLIEILKTGQVLLRKYVVFNADAKNPCVKFQALNNKYEEITHDPSAIKIIGVCEDNTRLSC